MMKMVLDCNIEDAVKPAKAAGNIARAAVTSGIEGAAVETAKEEAPRLIKLALCLLAVLLLIPMAVFAALPHVFFGFNNSKKPAVTEMTSQAMEIGSVYEYERVSENRH